jgi:coenzyme F420 hydrogenase subunit beta
LIVPKRTGLFDYDAEIITDRDGVMQSVDFPALESNYSMDKILKQSNYVSILPFVRLLSPRQSTKLAAVGTPCQISALRKMKILELSPVNNVIFSIGLFCMQCLSFDNLMEKTFVKKYQIDPLDITGINFKEEFKLNMRSGRTILIPSEDLADITRPSCLACQDFANDFADISIGGAGAPDGFTTTLIRTEIGERIFNDAVKSYPILRRLSKKNGCELRKQK